MDLSFDRRLKRKTFAGKEIYEIKPVILGGSPTDPVTILLGHLTLRQGLE